jgi:tetratricopeptide (TPR) repeat protein
VRRLSASGVPSPAARVLEGVPVQPFGDDDCGAGSLATVLEFFGLPIPLEVLDAELPKTARGAVLSVDLLLAARRWGLDAQWVVGDSEALARSLDQGSPPIVMLQVADAPGRRRDLYHYAVIDGFDPERQQVRLLVGDGRARWLSLRALDRAWRGAGRALLLPRPIPEQELGPEVLLHRAVALERGGRLAEAVAAYRALLEAHPDEARVWTNLGNAQAGLERFGEAEAAYRRAVALEPDGPDALNNLAWLLLREGSRLDEAEELARRALARQGPDQPAVFDTLGRILLARGRCAEAERVFEGALERIAPGGSQEPTELVEGLARARRCQDPAP